MLLTQLSDYKNFCTSARHSLCNLDMILVMQLSLQCTWNLISVATSSDGRHATRRTLLSTLCSWSTPAALMHHLEVIVRGLQSQSLCRLSFPVLCGLVGLNPAIVHCHCNPRDPSSIGRRSFSVLSLQLVNGNFDLWRLQLCACVLSWSVHVIV